MIWVTTLLQVPEMLQYTNKSTAGARKSKECISFFKIIKKHPFIPNALSQTKPKNNYPNLPHDMA